MKSNYIADDIVGICRFVANRICLVDLTENLYLYGSNFVVATAFIYTALLCRYRADAPTWDSVT